MSRWDRLVLLELVDAARIRLQDASISDIERHQLHALVDRFVMKTQSIEASRADVLALEEEISRISGLSGHPN